MTSTLPPDVATIRNSLVGLAQRRETANYIHTVNGILASHQHDVQYLDELHLLHISVWLTDCGDGLWKELLRIGCSPFAYDFNGDTSLHYAIRAANLPYLQYLYSKIGDRILDVVNHQLCNLMITCCAETPDERSTEVLHCLDWLYLCGVSLEAQDSQGKTALMWAAQRNSMTICQWLLSRGAHLAHRDHMNRTALHVACSSGNYDVVLYLCDQGAINLMNAESHDDRRINTPIRIAWQRGHLWLALNMWLWKLSHAMFGKCSFLVSPYAWAAFLLINWNLFCGEMAFWDLRRLPDENGELRRHWFAFTSLMFVTIVAWIFAAKRDPGAVKKRSHVMPDQAERCSDVADRDVRLFEKMYGGSQNCPSLNALRALECQSKKLSLQMARVNRDSHGVIRREVKANIETVIQALQELSDRMSAIRPAVAKERQKAAGNSYYVRRVMHPTDPSVTPPRLDSGLPVAGICLTCHHVKSIRQHHCSDCGVCVHRFDHHCVWIDNCVGVGNQTSFIVFLAALSAAQIYYALLAVLYVKENVLFERVPAVGGDSAKLVSHNLLHLLLTPLFYLTVLNVIINVLWFCFCNYLLFRTTRAMFTDVTFYETLKSSAYVERRFGRGGSGGAFWDFKGLTIQDALLNALHFLMQDTARDKINYGSSNPRNSLLHSGDPL